jgi:hypothetical protein
MSVQVKQRREASSFLATYTGAPAELIVDTTNNRLQVHDGATPGGHPAARLDEVVLLGQLASVAQGAFGSNIQFGLLEEEIVLSGAATSSTIQIPNRALVFAVSSRTTLAISGAPSYGIGISGNATQFGGALGIAAGSTNSGIIGPTAFYTATNVLVTATSGDFTAGKVRIAIHYMLCGVPTS